mmetsp:Transcript_32329/g.107886  ORF Transcript_32329/g.107886 Transcript_32329/m.107886 type:complete len:180 (-) Transcript_32329:236-775(-)
MVSARAAVGPAAAAGVVALCKSAAEQERDLAGGRWVPTLSDRQVEDTGEQALHQVWRERGRAAVGLDPPLLRGDGIGIADIDVDTDPLLPPPPASARRCGAGGGSISSATHMRRVFGERCGRASLARARWCRNSFRGTHLAPSCSLYASSIPKSHSRKPFRASTRAVATHCTAPADGTR